MYITTADKSTIPPINLMLVAITHQIILVIGDSIFLGRFELGDEVQNVYGVDAKFAE